MKNTTGQPCPQCSEMQFQVIDVTVTAEEGVLYLKCTKCGTHSCIEVDLIKKWVHPIRLVHPIRRIQ